MSNDWIGQSHTASLAKPAYDPRPRERSEATGGFKRSGELADWAGTKETPHDADPREVGRHTMVDILASDKAP